MTTTEMEPKKPNGKRKKILIAAGSAVIVMGVIWWLRSGGTENTNNAQIDGSIVPVRVSVAGYVHEVRFTDNQQVHKGDTLVVIDHSDYAAQVAQSEAALDNAKAMLEAARSGLNTADLNANASDLSSLAVGEGINTAETRLWKAQKELDRMNAMAKDAAATPQQVDAAQAEVEMAKAQLEMTRRQTDAARAQAGGARSQTKVQQAQVALAEANVKQREAELQIARIRLSHAVITAPFDGVISKKAVEVGQYVSIGSPICSAVDVKGLWITANFKETQLTDLRPGQAVDVRIDAFPDLELHGRVSSLGGATGARFSLLPPDNATGNFVKVTQRLAVRIDLDPAQDTAVYLAPGLSASVTVHTKG
ncbi:MAG: HlyD family secretion protein [Flavobacteriales bacterium]|nr:HlyD family secretion protein [Flavobacteriales bacterium]